MTTPFISTNSIAVLVSDDDIELGYELDSGEYVGHVRVEDHRARGVNRSNLPAGRLLRRRREPSRREARRERRPAVVTAARSPSATSGRVPESLPGDELYACPPSEFVEARKALVRRLRAEGDRDAAGQVAQLRRPTQSVWALNQVARQEPALIAALGEAGAQLRTATEQALAGDSSALRPAQDAERTAVDRVVDAAEAHLSARGESANGTAHQRMLDTLRATSTNSEASALLEAGRLTEDLTSAGLGLEGLSGPIAPRSGGQRRRAETITSAGAADAAKEAAAQQDELARARWTKLDQAATQAEAEASSLEAEADEAHRAAGRAAAAATKAQKLADEAIERARQARARADATSPR